MPRSLQQVRNNGNSNDEDRNPLQEGIELSPLKASKGGQGVASTGTSKACVYQ